MLLAGVQMVPDGMEIEFPTKTNEMGWRLNFPQKQTSNAIKALSHSCVKGKPLIRFTAFLLPVAAACIACLIRGGSPPVQRPPGVGKGVSAQRLLDDVGIRMDDTLQNSLGKFHFFG